MRIGTKSVSKRNLSSTRFVLVCEKKARWIEKIGFLRKCQKEGLVPKGLRVKLPWNIMNMECGERLKKYGRAEVDFEANTSVF